MSGDTKNISMNQMRPSKLNRGDPRHPSVPGSASLREQNAKQAAYEFGQWTPNGCAYAEGYDDQGPADGLEGFRAPAPTSLTHAAMPYPRRTFGPGNRSGE